MDQNERQIIDDLFERLRKAEGQAGPRDPDAEALIARHVAAQPAAPYCMAQAIVVQQDALGQAQTRIDELERRLAERRSGSFLGGLFGGADEAQAPATPARSGYGSQDFRHYQRAGGGGFLAGAMQTALGVAGGFLIADALSGLLSPDDAAAAGTAEGALPAEEDPFSGADPDLAEEETGGDFDVGGFDEF